MRRAGNLWLSEVDDQIHDQSTSMGESLPFPFLDRFRMSCLNRSKSPFFSRAYLASPSLVANCWTASSFPRSLSRFLEASVSMSIALSADRDFG